MLKDPFFIFYDSRSGSTYLANLLSKSAKIAIPPETNFIPLIIKNYNKKNISSLPDLVLANQIIFSDQKFNDWGLTKTEILEDISKKIPISKAEFIILIFEMYLKKNSQAAEYFGIKKNYSRYYAGLKKLFPDLKIISLIRDGRAVFRSKKTSIYSVTQKPFSTDPVVSAKDWCFEVTKTNQLLQNGEKVIKVFYEDLISNSEETVQKILKFLSVKFEPQADTYKIPERYGELHMNIKKSSDLSKIERWKKELSLKEILLYQAIAGKILKQEGYRLYKSKVNVKTLFVFFEAHFKKMLVDLRSFFTKEVGARTST